MLLPLAALIAEGFFFWLAFGNKIQNRSAEFCAHLWLGEKFDLQRKFCVQWHFLYTKQYSVSTNTAIFNSYINFGSALLISYTSMCLSQFRPSDVPYAQTSL